MNNIQSAEIFSDREAALKAPNNRKRVIETVREGIAKHKGKIKLNWIKAYVGYPGNEKADALAKKGVEGQGIKV